MSWARRGFKPGFYLSMNATCVSECIAIVIQIKTPTLHHASTLLMVFVWFWNQTLACLRINEVIQDLSNLVFFVLQTVDSLWTLWAGWSQCSASCGAGKQTRSRSCINPTSQQVREQCPGKTREEQACQQSPCPGSADIWILDILHI